MRLLNAGHPVCALRLVVTVMLLISSLAVSGCGSPFSFSVKDRDGRPLPGAAVLFEPESRVFLKMGTTVKRETDAEGRGRVSFDKTQQATKLTVTFEGFSYYSREKFWHPARAKNGSTRQIVRATFCGYDENFRGTRDKDLWEVVVEMWCDDESK